MSKIITEAQMNEIVQLAKNGHGEALIHYGGDMYHKGWTDMVKVTAIVEGGFLLGKLIYKLYKSKNRK